MNEYVLDFIWKTIFENQLGEKGLSDLATNSGNAYLAT